MNTDLADGTDLNQETLDELLSRALRRWNRHPDGSRDVAPDALCLVTEVLGAWADEVRAAHADGATRRRDDALAAMTRDALQMVTTAAVDAHLHHYSHAGKGEVRSNGQRYTDEDIAEQFRKSLAECGKATAAAAETAGAFQVSERTAWRALQRLGITTAR